jgi:hypothetical protein
MCFFSLDKTHDIPVGARHNTLFDDGRKYWYAYHRTRTVDYLVEVFMIWNYNRTEEPLPRGEVRSLARSIDKWTRTKYTGEGGGVFTAEDRLHSAEKRRYLVEKRRKEIAEFFYTYGEKPDYEYYFFRWGKSKRMYHYDMKFIEEHAEFEDGEDMVIANLVFFQNLPRQRIASWGVQNYCDQDHPGYVKNFNIHPRHPHAADGHACTQDSHDPDPVPQEFPVTHEHHDPATGIPGTHVPGTHDHRYQHGHTDRYTSRTGTDQHASPGHHESPGTYKSSDLHDQSNHQAPCHKTPTQFNTDCTGKKSILEYLDRIQEIRKRLKELDEEDKEAWNEYPELDQFFEGVCPDNGQLQEFL